jgi:hypothetical protein
MAKECKIVLNPLALKRNGTTQQSRYTTALDTSFAKIDDKTLADDLVFSQKLAAFLHFFDAKNNSMGNWQPFFAKDVSTQLALISTQNVEGVAANIKALMKSLQDSLQDNLLEKTKFSQLFSAMFSLALQVENLSNHLSEELLLKNTIKALWKNKLIPQYEKLIIYYDKALLEGLIIEDEKNDLQIFGGICLSAKDARNALSLVLPITIDTDIFGTTNRKIYFATNHNFFKDCIDVCIRGLSKIVEEAKSELQKTLTNWDNHEPHNALFLAFLQLFDYARQQQNGLTQRHLDLYYREILQLKNKAASPNQVHIVFELAKFVEDYLLPKGTLLKGGKDSLGKDILYSIDEDIAVNTAQITALKSIFIADIEDIDNGLPTEKRVFSTEVLNSSDGQGEPFEELNTAWHPFAAKGREDFSSVQKIKMSAARLGLGFASHYLFLREGKRTITLTLNVDKVLTSNINVSDFVLEISSAKGWLSLGNVTLTVANKTLVFSGELLATQPSTAPYQQTIHGGSFETQNPVFKISFKTDSPNNLLYSKLRDCFLESYSLKVAVDRVKNIHVQTDSGVMDSTKPFMPFGAVPHIGAMLIIGCDEVFQKIGAIITPQFVWREGTVSSKIASPSLSILRHTESWYPIRHPLNIFDTIDEIKNTYLREHFYVDHITNILPIFSEENILFSPKSVAGFIRYHLTSDLGYQQSFDERVVYLTALAKGEGGPPKEEKKTYIPPTLQEVSLAYSAETTEAEIFHLYPFGEIKTNPNKGYLLPQFFHNNLIRENSLGEFYIGIQGFEPPRKLNILFQIDESSANPLIEKPKNQVKWHYLVDNGWKEFKKEEISDRTLDLLRSGIIAFNIPKKANKEHTLLPKGKYWLKASITSADEAVCKIIAVLPQAVTATFYDVANAADAGALPMSAGAIAKFQVAIPEVKKIQQPYTSFGGTSIENDKDFCVRISERLRHKDKGVNIWDYEHLILEAFPSLYRAKCLPHTRFDTTKGIYNELAPGHVTIITIPNIRQRNAIDPLRPYTFVADLEKVKRFLATRISPFVQLHIRNPEYEEIRVDANVKIAEGYDVTLFLNRLKEEVTRYLAPWAYQEGVDLKFEGRVTTAMVVNFMEDRYYVDFVTEVRLYHQNEFKDIITPTKQSSILVPVKVKEHQLIEYQDITTNNFILKRGTTSDCSCE